MAPITLVLTLLSGITPPQGGYQPPDLSGRWTFDVQKTMAPDKDGRVVLAAMLGDEFTALQTASSLTLRILTNGQLVVAVYDLTGRPTDNVSPGDIVVTSRARWKQDRLVISSISTSEVEGERVTVESTRVLWIDTAGDLIVERSGTPTRLVTPSRSVYRRAKK